MRVVGSSTVRLLWGLTPTGSVLVLELNDELRETFADEGRCLFSAPGAFAVLEIEDLLESTLAEAAAALAFILRVRKGVPGADFGDLSETSRLGFTLPFRDVIGR